MKLTERTAEEVGLYLMGQGLMIEEEPIWFEEGWGITVNHMPVHIMEQFGTILLRINGELHSFARIKKDYATPKLLAEIIATVLEAETAKVLA